MQLSFEEWEKEQDPYKVHEYGTADSVCSKAILNKVKFKDLSESLKRHLFFQYLHSNTKLFTNNN